MYNILETFGITRSLLLLSPLPIFDEVGIDLGNEKAGDGNRKEKAVDSSRQSKPKIALEVVIPTLAPTIRYQNPST